jgi:predicted RecA/RadA family phage recombinase
MKNYVQPGDIITLIAPYAVLSGGGLLVGSIFGVAMYDALISTEVEAKTTGVFDLPKTTGQAWSQGARVYWDDTTKACTTTASTNKLIGVITDAALSADTVGRVLLTQAFTL